MKNTKKPSLEQRLWAEGSTWSTAPRNIKIPDSYAVAFNRECRKMYTTHAIDEMESEVADLLIKRMFTKNHLNVPIETVNKLIRRYELSESKRLNCNFRLAEYQAEAIRLAVSSQLMVLTGGPGTGKTCVIKGIVYVLRMLFKRPLMKLAAPTGKAARRMTESVGFPASTVQRLMGLTETGSFAKPIYGDFIIVDEVSMLDIQTLNSLLKTLQGDIKLIFVGDIDQLPSVGSGAILRDMIESFVIPCVMLDAPHRQKADSLLYSNICTVRKGHDFLTEGDDFHIIDADDTTGIEEAVDQYLHYVPIYGIDQTVILTPFRKSGQVCANKINDLIQKRINPYHEKPKDSIRTTVTDKDGNKRSYWLVKGDPVMQLINREECSNGDVGKVINVNKTGVQVRFSDSMVFYKPNELNQLTLAYSMSIHKSQGSEYQCVITPILKEHETVVTRNLIYTALTRAKKICVLIQDKDTVKKGLKKEAASLRYTMLSEKIETAYRVRR